MAKHAPITGAPTRAPAFTDFDLSRIDHLSGKMDTLKSLIWVAIDLVAADDRHGENLLHAALQVYDSVTADLRAIHTDLIAIKREANDA
jgi:hypothetical protein